MIITKIRERLMDAKRTLQVLSDTAFSVEERRRLEGKIEGVSLALSYLDEELAWAGRPISTPVCDLGREIHDHGDHDSLPYDGANSNLSHLCQICGEEIRPN